MDQPMPMTAASTMAAPIAILRQCECIVVIPLCAAGREV
jgi:hypothetical protein